MRGNAKSNNFLAFMVLLGGICGSFLGEVLEIVLKH